MFQKHIWNISISIFFFRGWHFYVLGTWKNTFLLCFEAFLNLSFCNFYSVEKRYFHVLCYRRIWLFDKQLKKVFICCIFQKMALQIKMKTLKNNNKKDVKKNSFNIFLFLNFRIITINFSFFLYNLDKTFIFFAIIVKLSLLFIIYFFNSFNSFYKNSFWKLKLKFHLLKSQNQRQSKLLNLS